MSKLMMLYQPNKDIDLRAFVVNSLNPIAQKMRLGSSPHVEDNLRYGAIEIIEEWVRGDGEKCCHYLPYVGLVDEVVYINGSAARNWLREKYS